MPDVMEVVMSNVGHGGRQPGESDPDKWVRQRRIVLLQPIDLGHRRRVEH